MRVAIYGSLRTLESDCHKAFKRTCADLGIELARRGHIPLLHSEGEKTADHFVFRGLTEFARQANGTGNTRSQPRAEIHRTTNARRIYQDEDLIDIIEVPYPDDEKQAKETADKRIGPRVGTIAASDVVVLIGGSTGTHKSGAFSRQLKKPVLAIPYLGGSALEFYSSEMEKLYLADERISPKIGELSQPKGGCLDAAVLVSMCQTLANLHTYFVSYSRENSHYADRLEVLLRRAHRRIRRDEHEVKLTKKIKEILLEGMARSDTFVCLWSRDAAVSDWCKWERKTALEMVQKGARLRRAVMILMDDTPLPKRWGKRLQLEAREIQQLDFAVHSLINDEAPSA
ncbi:MAG: toll/interleukin-1 receptor domain-containing protein [Pseudomonadota bacterium]